MLPVRIGLVIARKDIHNSNVPVLCQSCEARHRGLCGALDPEQLSELARSTRVVRHEAGEQLVREADEPGAYANVMAGVVKLTKTLEDGRRQVVGLQFAPDFLGRLYGTENHLGAEAASDVELCRVPRAALEKLVGENPALENRLMRQALRELDEARDWIVTLGRKSAEEKVASFLYLIATHANPRAAQGGRAEFRLPLSRADIADFLGLTIETVSRQLTRLKGAGVIEIDKLRDIVVPDLAVLEERCG
ncbi:Crp/Fnr family transcriptional regulator [Methyloterrigena soli]|uniref:Crp/Fnr family transcriptional regulator n=1 Tax=Paradevosia shaoguanensis TaxID=1335043 RepID=A0AA41UBS6_9HYPH|nr:Crp/Fnr family transcriptional regulator [Paradevosia shaoguanensis]MCF1742984.1 Crp/Fnr family transcriptional regulator [Paradevosia shaoguanensis]MCI0127467.1 Crp/Fnr family transcriptional regulator [Paradevosia shaoguanensis]